MKERKAGKAADKPKRERRKAREAKEPGPLAQALPLLERLRPPSTGDLLTVVALVAICLVVGAAYWIHFDFPAPW